MGARTAPPSPTYARISSAYYAVAVAAFCVVLLISNIAAVKAIQIGGLTFDGGALLFPLGYVLGDVLSEVYGFARARTAIWTGFVLSALASLTFLAVDALPAAPGWELDEAFGGVLGFVPALVLASLAAYVVGQLLNAYVLVKIKERTAERALWARLIASTLVGQLADTLIFCLLATTIGPIPFELFWNYVIVGYLFKCAVEVVVLPVTYRVIAFLKRREPGYRPPSGSSAPASPRAAHGTSRPAGSA